MEWMVNNMTFTVLKIEEDLDFGCEERPDGASVTAVVTLQDSSGNQTTVRQPDQMLYDRKIDVGTRVIFDEQGKLAVI